MNMEEVRAKGSAIQTANGTWAYPLDPFPEMIDIEDIAQALSNQCRFSGHVKKFYSVGEHSCRVAQLLDHWEEQADTILWGLLHDASEAYLVDLARPLKEDLTFAPRYREAEAALMSVIQQRFNLLPKMPDIVKYADQVLLSTEQRDLMPAGEVWYPEVGRLDSTITPWTPEETKKEFLYWFDNLGGIR